MTWAKLSDDWADHPDIIAVSRSARLLHLEALLWSLAQNQDGAIPARALGRITDADDPQADAANEGGGEGDDMPCSRSVS